MTGPGKGSSGRGPLTTDGCRLPRALSLASHPGSLRAGRWVRAARPLRNDGTYPHREIGDVLVDEGDVGYVLEVVEFCGESYYTVEFVGRSVVVGTRQRNLRTA